MYNLSPTIGPNTKVTLAKMSRIIKLKRKKKLTEFLSNSLSVFLFVVAANFSEARQSSPKTAKVAIGGVRGTMFEYIKHWANIGITPSYINLLQNTYGAVFT